MSPGMSRVFILGACSAAQLALSLSTPLPAQTAASDAAASANDTSNISVSLSLSPNTVAVGQQTTLSWSSNNATSASINGATVPPAGSYTVAPAQTTPFTLTVAGAGGTATASSTVTVTANAAPAPTAPAAPASTSPSAPHINYTDINVGGGTGGDNGNGAYVRIFGNHFGTSQGSGTATLGGKLITNCSHCSWTDKLIVAQLGSGAKTGSIVVTAQGLTSNGVPFTITPTDIFFVANGGSDGNTGSYSAPFKTWRAAFNAATQGDSASPARNTIIYLEPGVSATNDDGRGYRAAMSTDIGGSSPTRQIAIVGFPGGVAKVGSTQIDNGIHGWAKYLTIANLTITGASSAIDAEAGNIRIINNDISCPAPPSGVGGTACVLGETDTPSDTWVFQGNNVHDTGGHVDKTYHAVYFSTGVNHAEVGWNSIGQNFKGYCRSLMFHASQGGNLSDLHIHDNNITGGYCDAIGLASVDPSRGTVEVYNNVISHVAIASNPYGVANEAGIAINSDPAGGTSGTVQVYNNTVVDAGGYTQGNQNGCFGVVMSGAGLNLVNNICSQPNSSQPYIEPKSQNVTGSHNLWHGAGSPPSWDTSPMTSDPSFVSSGNFALQPASPAKKSGVTSKTSAYDITSSHRASPPSRGAYE